jgi:hypothetical protein
MRPPVRNKFPGHCYKCGCYVEVATGHFEHIAGTKVWHTKHALYPGHGGVTCEMARAGLAAELEVEIAQAALNR